MSEKVKLSKDGSSIDFVQSESLPTSMKKFRQSPEIEGFYRFIFENDLYREAYGILDRIIQGRKAKKAAEKAAVKEASKAVKDAEKAMAKAAAQKAKEVEKANASAKGAKPVVKAPPAKTTLKPTPKAAAKPAKVAATKKPASKAAAKPAAKAKPGKAKPKKR